MANVYGFCDAGCRRRVVPYEEFANSAAYVRQHKDETGKFHFEKGKEYKIFAPLDSAGNFACMINVLDKDNYIKEIEHKNNDKYADSFIFKLLDYFIDEDEANNIVVYELAGVRYKTAIERTTSLSDGDIASIYVEGATDILLVNTDAKIVLENSLKVGNTEITEEQLQALLALIN